MANERPSETDLDITITSDPEPDQTDSLSKGQRLVEQSRQEIGRLHSLLDETNQLVAELERVTAVFESVAEELVAATVRASTEATGSGPGRPTTVTLVEELAALARRSLLASSDGRRHLRAYDKAKPTAIAGKQAPTALDALSALLKRLSEDAAERDAVPVIVVEAPPPPAVPRDTSSSWRTSFASAIRDADPSKPRRYKN